MKRFTYQGRGLRVVALFSLLLGCARSKPTLPPSSQPSVEQATRVCTALAQAQPLETRFIGVLPVELGGLLLVLGDTKEADVARALSALGLSATNMETCGADKLVLFLSGVSGPGAESLSRQLQSRLPAARIVESAQLAPQAMPPRPRPTNN